MTASTTAKLTELDDFCKPQTGLAVPNNPRFGWDSHPARTSKPASGHTIFPYLLRQLPLKRPNKVSAMDITYIPMARGIVYLAAVVDWFSRKVLAWKLSITLETEFCLEAAEEALSRHGKPDIFNTESKNIGACSPSAARSLSLSSWSKMGGYRQVLQAS